MAMVKLFEVADGVWENLNHLQTHPDRFLIKNGLQNIFQMIIFGQGELLVLHQEVDFEGVVELKK